MDYSNRWEKTEKLGEGGQGKVYRVIDKSKFKKSGRLEEIFKGIANNRLQEYKNKFEELRKAILEIVNMKDPANNGALKELHTPEDARDPDNAEKRIKREIEAMSKVSHPNLLKILDYDSDGKWFVSQYYPKGSLEKNLDIFKGNFSKALRAFRPLVEGVAVLHKHKKCIVHRDIKPQNVFLDENDNLILGDFGIVFFEDAEHTRLSAKYDNVGSRDWRPTWYDREMIEDIKPSFDVFTLGKLLWSMVSGKSFLNLWYYDSPKNDLERMFPYDNSIKFAKEIFKECIVEYEKDCCINASILLKTIDRVLFDIENSVDSIAPGKDRKCKVCGIGIYKQKFTKDVHGLENLKDFGLTEGREICKIFICAHCGHVQIFASTSGRNFPEAWEK